MHQIVYDTDFHIGLDVVLSCVQIFIHKRTKSFNGQTSKQIKGKYNIISKPPEENILTHSTQIVRVYAISIIGPYPISSN